MWSLRLGHSTSIEHCADKLSIALSMQEVMLKALKAEISLSNCY